MVKPVVMPFRPPELIRSGWVSVWCVVAAFGTYFCMYGFRKPFTAGTYSEVAFAGLDVKTLLVVAQVLGYTVSKFLGIKIVSETAPTRRAALLLTLIALAWATLLLFALTPSPWNAAWLFANGLMLGMVFGLVLGFLEGRRQSEALAAGLCVSFIVADGVTKSVGRALLDAGVSEAWMPVTAGLLFAGPLTFFTWMLTRVPGPTAEDIRERCERVPMNGSQRSAFFRRYAVGLVLVVLLYLLVTILRSVRADFAPELWESLGTPAGVGTFTLSEAAVGAVVLAMIATMTLVRDNRRAFFVGLALAGIGCVVSVAALTAWHARFVGPFAFMVLLGIGLYVPYLVIHCTLFERLLAVSRDRATVGYLMYLADSFGYLGYVGVLIVRKAVQPTGDFLVFFLPVGWTVAGGGLVLIALCWWYFASHPALRREGSQP